MHPVEKENIRISFHLSKREIHRDHFIRQDPAVFAPLEGLYAVDAGRTLISISVSDFRLEPFRRQGVKLFDLAGQPSEPLLRAFGDGVRIPANPRKPLVKLRFVAVGHPDLVYDHIIDVNHHGRFERGRLAEVIRYVHHDRGIIECRGIRADIRNHQQIRGILNQQARIAVVRVIVVRPMGQNGNQGGTPGSAIRMGDWKLIEFFEDGRVELYHLGEDIQEARNLADAFPERASVMRNRLDGWRLGIEAGIPVINPDYAGL